MRSTTSPIPPLSATESTPLLPPLRGMATRTGKVSLQFTLPPSPPPGSPAPIREEETPHRREEASEVTERTRGRPLDTATHSPESERNQASLAPASPSNAKGQSRRRHVPTFLKALTPSLTLENSGSVARDHLASERYAELAVFSSPMSFLTDTSTFLAYVRTSLAIASTGVGEFLVVTPFVFSCIIYKALVQLFTIATNTSSTASRGIQVYARPLGATTVAFGMAVLVIGIYHPTCPIIRVMLICLFRDNKIFHYSISFD
jgi:hypothetical protein